MSERSALLLSVVLIRKRLVMSASSRPVPSSSSLSSSMNPPSPWVQYYDEASAAYYWFNNDTGESRWAEEQGLTAGEEDELPLYPKQRGSHVDRFTEGQLAPQLATEEERAEWRRSISRFYYFALINMVVCEAPACLIEAFFRIGTLSILLVLSLLAVLLGRIPGTQAKELASCISRDMLLTFAAALSLLVPGLVCFAYRGFHQSSSYSSEESEAGNDNWELRPIPTFLGAVDCRRFSVITVFGTGAMASNAVYSVQSRGREICRDAWEQSVVYYPRNVLQRLQSMV